MLFSITLWASLALALAAPPLTLKSGECQTVHATVGEVLEVELQGLPSAGFFWDVTVSDTESSSLSPRTLHLQRTQILPASLIGGQQTTVFRFKAGSPGAATAVFRYSQAGTRPQFDSSTLTVLVSS